MRSGAAWCAKLARPLIKNCLLQYGLLLGLALAGAGAAVRAQELPLPASSGPSFAELEGFGARIGQIRIIAQDMFDLNDPRENGGFYRFANLLHINTRENVIRRLLL